MIVLMFFDISLSSSKDPGGNGGTRVKQGHEGSDVWRALAAEIVKQRSKRRFKDLFFSRASTWREMRPE
jgi:hypothetical protein